MRRFEIEIIANRMKNFSGERERKKDCLEWVETRTI